MARKQQAEEEARIDEALAAAAAALHQSAARVNAWPLSGEGFSAIAPGLEATFRAGQKAMSRARKHPRPENYHDWRKRVKEHWYHIRLLENVWDGATPAYERRLKDLETLPGEEDHNLVVLEDQPEAGKLAGLIAKYRKELRENALAIGERIYTGKPSRFTKRIRRQWEKPAAPGPRSPASPEPSAPVP